MRKTDVKKSHRLNFNEYLALLGQLKGEALQKWNRESLKRSNLLQEEISRESESNIRRYLENPNAERTLAEQRKHTGVVTLRWEINMEPGECYLRVRVGDTCRPYGVLGGHPILDRITVKRFISIINQYLIAASVSLFESSAIYSSETVAKSNPRYWRERFINEQIARWEALTGKRKKIGRPENTGKNCLQKLDDTNKLKKRVLGAVRNLYFGKSTNRHHCPKHKQNSCRGHDVEEINVRLAAGYLNTSEGTLRNQLSKARLKFPALKREALSGVID